MTDRDFSEATPNDDQKKAAVLQAKLDAERAAHRATKAILKQSDERVLELEELMDRFTAVHPDDVSVPAWVKKKPQRKSARHATALLALSDLHLDEVVDLHEMNGMNEYSRAIAERRYSRVIDTTADICQSYITGLHWDGIVVPFNGDFLTGDIHDELARTNEAPAMASIVHWVPKLASGLRYLADAFGHVHVPCTDGNHDRFYKKIPAKNRAESALSWVLYNWIADTLRDDDRITFSITTAPGQVYRIYDTWIHQIHGDGFSSSGGIGGIYPSMLKYLLRMDRLHAGHRQRIDVHLLGHWHQYLTGPNFIVNGSLKGVDEWAKSKGLGADEPPRQALAVVTPERGIVHQLPVYAEGVSP